VLRTALIGLAIAAAMALAPMAARGQEAGRRASPARRPEAPDYKIVFWLAGEGGWKYQVYDVRKGQFTRAVEDWVRRTNRLRFDATGYAHVEGLATVREVFLDRESGASEREKLAAAIRRELRPLESPDLRALRPYQPSPAITGHSPAYLAVGARRNRNALGASLVRPSYVPAASPTPVMRFRPP
jgi:hypothetical protein